MKPKKSKIKDIRKNKKNLKKVSKIYMKKAEIRKINIQGIDMAKNVILDNNNLEHNTYMRITYMNKQFKLCSRQYIKQKKITYKCIFYRTEIKNDIKPYTFCKAIKIAIRKDNNIKDFLFYIKENHSKDCDAKYENIILEDNEKINDNNLKEGCINNNISNKIIQDKKSDIDNDNNKSGIHNKITDISHTKKKY